MRTLSMDIEELMKTGNVVKEAVLAALEKDGLLKKPASEIGDSYVVVVAEPRWFGKLFRKVTGKEDEKELRIYVMKAL